MKVRLRTSSFFVLQQFGLLSEAKQTGATLRPLYLQARGFQDVIFDSRPEDYWYYGPSSPTVDLVV